MIRHAELLYFRQIGTLMRKLLGPNTGPFDVVVERFRHSRERNSNAGEPGWGRIIASSHFEEL